MDDTAVRICDGLIDRRLPGRLLSVVGCDRRDGCAHYRAELALRRLPTWDWPATSRVYGVYPCEHWEPAE